jgi:hypothetical protein
MGGVATLDEVAGEEGEGGKSNSNSWWVGRQVGSGGISALKPIRDLRSIVM